MTTEEKLNIAIKALTNISLHYKKGAYDVEYWDSGNYDDAWEWGIEAGQSDMAELAGEALQEIKDG